ncbi:MAG: gliding motility protein GldN [Marivirga sp.]|nr:gliding motility protein GldN [Marivirga sp.]
MKKSLFILVFCSAVGSAMAQEVQDLEVQYNPNSLNPIPVYEQHYKVRVWRNIDLREKQNKGFFAKNGEISRLIVDAVRSGELTDIYKDDSLTSKLSKEEFMGRLIAEQAQTFPAWDPAADFYTDDIVSYNGKNYRAVQDSRGVTPSEDAVDNWAVTSQGSGLPYAVSDMTTIHMMEDIIFDRRRSRLYYDIQGIEIIIPGAKTNTSIDMSLGWFKYKDLEKLFRNNIPKAVWFNRQNTAQNKNFADAILLRLFQGSIYKIQNPDDETLDDTYRGNGRPYYEGVWAREWTEMMLMEKEHNLWEF